MNIKSEIKEAFVQNKKIFKILIVLFVIGFIIGCVFSKDFASIIMPMLKQAIANDDGVISIEALDIIIHNVSSTLLVFIGSILFGIYALFSITINGFAIGFMAGYTINSVPSLLLYLALIVPHGILEIPAFFCGDASGVILFLFIYRVNKDKMNKNTFKEGYENNKETLKHAIILLSISIVLFVIAGLIEGYITPLVGNFVSQQVNGTPLF